MTDRELLEFAAKAAGLDFRMEYDKHIDCPCYIDDGFPVAWNPLHDDGDALRLAVKLMEFDPYKSRGYLPCITSDAEFTRRAIVRAAAEIGKAMP